MARAPRPEHEIEHRRAHILDAAARVFASHGFERTSIEDIAKEAGYGASTLYGYFKGKDAIVAGIIDRFFEDMEGSYAMVLPEGLTFRQSLELFLRHQLSLIEKRRAALAFIMLRGMPEMEGHAEYMAREAALQDRFAGWILMHAAAEDLGPYSAETAARMLNALMMGELFHWVRHEDSLPMVSRTSLILDFFFHGVAGPPASGALHASRS